MSAMHPLFSRVCRPALVYPDHSLSLEEMLGLAERYYGDLPSFRLIARMIANTQIEQRRLALGPGELGRPLPLSARTERYMELALPLARRACLQALEHARLEPGDIDLIITTSCTSFVMPSLDAYLINELGFRPEVGRMPLAQLGCVAGACALLAANDYCRAYPEARVLIVAVELSSLCFFPEQRDLSSAVCASIFGDGAAACVVSGAQHAPRPGLQLHGSLSYTVPNSEHYIRYQALDMGYHLSLDNAVMHTVPKLAPTLSAFLANQGIEKPDFVVAHTGGRRIIDGLAGALQVDPALLEPSRASLREFGNTASVSVFDVLARLYEHDPVDASETTDARGLVVAFGPGFTMAALGASWRPH